MVYRLQDTVGISAAASLCSEGLFVPTPLPQRHKGSNNLQGKAAMAQRTHRSLLRPLC